MKILQFEIIQILEKIYFKKIVNFDKRNCFLPITMIFSCKFLRQLLRLN